MDIISAVVALAVPSLAYVLSVIGKLANERFLAKKKVYEDLIKEISWNMTTRREEHQNDFTIAINCVALCCSSKVARHLENVKEITSNGNSPDYNDLCRKYTDLICAMRKDLYRFRFDHAFPTIKLIGNNSKGNQAANKSKRQHG